MITALESPNTVTAQTPPVSEPAIARQQQADPPVSMFCDLAHADAFIERHNLLHVPILAAFGGDRLHECRLKGSWDISRAALENPDALFRSIHMLPYKDAIGEWDDLTFQFGPRSFLYADKNRLVGFASTPTEAEFLVMRFGEKYLKPPASTGGSFYLIQQNRNNIDCHEVTLPAETILTTEAFRLRYGNDGEVWHQDFIGELRAKHQGLSIFEGRPGTGKTFYLRHLMGVLAETHRFYFIPPATLDVLSKPEFTSFWADQRRIHSNRRFLVILEDADAALMTRGADNREQVSAILNLSDGMLADFLRLQIICTINCTTADIDPALLRPGRLLCHRIFRRLDYAQAARLAESLGRKLPVASDYSLAEVFTGQVKHETNSPHIGFNGYDETR